MKKIKLLLLTGLLMGLAIVPGAKSKAAQTNTSIGNAIEVNLNELTSVIFEGTENETYYYKFTTPDSGNFDYTISLSNSMSDTATLQVYDSSVNHLDLKYAHSQNSCSIQFKTEGSISHDSNMLSPNTTYYISISPLFSTDKLIGEAYLKVSCSSDDSWGSLSKANSISLNNIIQGRLEIEGDVDSYVFTLPNDGCRYNVVCENGTAILKDSSGVNVYGDFSSYKQTYELIGNGQKYYMVFDTAHSLSNFNTKINYSFQVSKQETSQNPGTPSTPTLRAQYITTAKIKTFKAKQLKKKKASFSLRATSTGDGSLSYRVTKGNKKYISVSSSGKVTLKKKCKKGTYKITVTAARTNYFYQAQKVVSIKVK